MIVVFVLILVAACGGHEDPATPAARPGASSCAAQAAELRQFIIAAYEPSRPPLAAPFATGDAARDARIQELRARARELLKPMDPSQPLEPLSPAGRPSPLETELAPCAAAAAQLTALGNAPPGKRVEATAQIADAIAGCHCNVDLSLVRALFYLDARGPD